MKPCESGLRRSTVGSSRFVMRCALAGLTMALLLWGSTGTNSIIMKASAAAPFPFTSPSPVFSPYNGPTPGSLVDNSGAVPAGPLTVNGNEFNPTDQVITTFEGANSIECSYSDPNACTVDGNPADPSTVTYHNTPQLLIWSGNTFEPINATFGVPIPPAIDLPYTQIAVAPLSQHTVSFTLDGTQNVYFQTQNLFAFQGPPPPPGQPTPTPIVLGQYNTGPFVVATYVDPSNPASPSTRAEGFIIHPTQHTYIGPQQQSLFNGGQGPKNNAATDDAPFLNFLSNQFYYATTDLAIPARGIPFTVSRVHQTQQLINSKMPAVWQWNVVQTLDVSVQENLAKFTYPDGRWVQFKSPDGVNFVPASDYADVTDTLTQNADGTFDLVTPQKTKLHFIPFMAISSNDERMYIISSVTDRNNNTLTWNYTSDFAITSITDGAGRALNFNMAPITVEADNGAGTGPAVQVQINSITDWIGRTWTYGGYITFPHMGCAPTTFTAPPTANGQVQTTTYSYDSNGRLLSIVDALGNTVISNVYDPTDAKVVRQTRSNGDTWNYNGGGGGIMSDPPSIPGLFSEQTLSATRSQNGVPEGTAIYTSFPTAGAIASYTNANGHTDSYLPDVNTGRIVSRTDDLGNTWSFTWDAQGNLTGTQDPLGNTWNVAYDPTFNVPTQVTSPLGQVWSYGLDGNGNVIAAQDPLGHTNAYGRDPFGEIVSMTNPLGKTAHMAYNANGDLVSYSNELNQTTTFTVDAVGRTLAATDPNGHTSSAAYDTLDRVTNAQDALGNASSFQWDPNDNLATAVDPLQRMTTFAYSSINEMTSATNPLLQVTKFSYDGLDLLSQVTNPKNVNALSLANNLIGEIKQETLVTDQTGITYDQDDRISTVTRPDGSEIVYTLDADGRPVNVQFVPAPDPPGGVTPKSLARPAAATVNTSLNPAPPNAQTNIGYIYDAAGRVTEMDDDIGATTYVYEYADRHLGLDGGKVQQLLRVGRALEGLPLLSEAVRDGRVSWCKAREITRVATADDDTSWVEFAAQHTTREVEQRVSRRPRSHAVTSTVVPRPAPAPVLSPVVTGSDASPAVCPDDTPTLFELEPLIGSSGTPDPLPLPPPLIRLVAALDAESYAIFEAARDMLTRRLGRRLSLEQVLTEMASIVLASGDARARARYAVVVHVGAERASFQTDRGNLPVEPRQVEVQPPANPIGHKVEGQAEDASVKIAHEQPSEVPQRVPLPKKHADKKRRKLPTAVMRKVLARAGHRCERCGRRGYLELDHKQPLSVGGTDEAENLRVLCRACHALRHRQKWVLEALPKVEVREAVGSHDGQTSAEGPYFDGEY